MLVYLLVLSEDIGLLCIIPYKCSVSAHIFELRLKKMKNGSQILNLAYIFRFPLIYDLDKPQTYHNLSKAHLTR